MGRIIERKGIDFLIDVWNEVNKTYDGAILLLIGPVDYESKGKGSSIDPFISKLKDKIARYNLETKIVFIGETNIVHRYLQIADVFVFASTAEGLPSAPIEAMAAAVPPVVLNIKDIMTDIINSGQDGIIIENKNVSEFSEAVVRLLQNNEYREKVGKNARKKVEQYFSEKKVCESYIKLFKGLYE